MQQDLFLEHTDYSGQKVMLGTSGGINSAAVLVWLAGAPDEYKPSELHMQYHHFKQHSPDTEAFVLAQVEYAQKHFAKVIYTQSNNDVLQYFKEQKIIPHPAISPCTRVLKIEPTYRYMAENDIKVNVVGYIREEIRRVKRMAKRTDSEITNVISEGISVQFPIAHFTDEWCFQVVKKAIGWYPAIYDIKDEKGRRVFQHNNCLPCKNMHQGDLENVKRYYPDYFEEAHQLSLDLNKHWGRNADEYYTTFGRPDHEKTVCETCAF